MVHWEIVLGLPTRLLTALVSILLMLLTLRNLGILRLQSATIPLPPKSTHSVRRLVLKESLCRPIGDEADLKKLARYSLYKLLLKKQARRIQVVYSIGKPQPQPNHDIQLYRDLMKGSEQVHLIPNPLFRIGYRMG